jgi:sugar lactone lactonase YvrE
MYWTDIGSIRRANLDGTDVENSLVTGIPGPLGIALDQEARHVYWTDTVTEKIQRADFDGANVVDIVTGLNDPRGLALDIVRGKVYWADTAGGRIKRANLDGTGVETLVLYGQKNPHGISLDIEAGKMYWTTIGFIRRANMDGAAVETVITAPGCAAGLALDIPGSKVYLTCSGTDKIQRANLDGSGLEDLVTTGLDTPWGIVLTHPSTLEFFIASR